MKRFNLFLAFTFIFLYSCQKEQESCESLRTTLFKDYEANMFLGKPSFNPNNSDELVFVHKTVGTYKAQLITYNWKTRKSNVLIEGFEDLDNFGSVSWSKEGWIAFVDHQYDFDQLAVIRSDGSDLTYLNRKARGVQFGDDGLLYFKYWGSKAELAAKYMLYSFDLNRNSYDTIAYYTDYTCTDNKMKFSLSKERKITDACFLDVPLKEQELLNFDTYQSKKWKNSAFGGDVAYAPNGEFVYFTNGTYGIESQLNRIDVISKKVEVLKQECDFIRYGDLEISGDGRYLAVERQVHKETLENKQISREILIIDLTTKKEHIIEL